MSKIMQLLTNPRIIVLFIVLFLSLLFIHPNPYNNGAAIRSITRDSPGAIAGLQSPDPSTTLMAREKIVSIVLDPTTQTNNAIQPVRSHTGNKLGASQNLRSLRSLHDKTPRKKKVQDGLLIRTVEDYYAATTHLIPNKTIQIITNKGIYAVAVSEAANTTASLSTKDIGIHVSEVPKSNLRKGLDLQGGTRALLRPEKKLSVDEQELIMNVLKQRLNIYGLSDIIVKEAKDLSGNAFILVEVAGASEEEVQKLIAKQGKFEAKIKNVTVFRGGGDITFICSNARCARVIQCKQRESGSWFCGYSFSISLHPDAADRQAAVTKELDVVHGNESHDYLSKNLTFYLDDHVVSSLRISSSLKGRSVTDISISGSGNGSTQKHAMTNAMKNMKELQTVLATGSLPVKLDMVKADSLSPIMGQQFSTNVFWVALFALLAVIFIVFIRYRTVRVAVPIALSMLSELVIILGIAALIKWNLDLASIAGIIVSIGTGVDDLIVISDEMLDKTTALLNWKAKRKNAFFIIMAAYVTTVVAMTPLFFAGAGLLRGFALTTIIGVSSGVFIVRPAFADTMKIILDR